MEKHRYYFRLKRPFGQLCEEYDRDLPSEKSLAKTARDMGFAFNEKSVQPALFENAPFSDGLLHALSIWLGGVPASSLVDLTLDCPQYKESRLGDSFLMGMRPLVEKLTGNQRLREEAFFKSQKDIERATEITLVDFGACYWESDEQSTTCDLLKTALEFGREQTLADYHESLSGYWRFNPLTIIYAVTSSRNKVGASCVLPLMEGTYDLVKSGSKSVYDLTTTDLVWPSNRQLIYIAATRMDDRNSTPVAEQTRCVASSIFIQIAMMAAQPLDDLQVISFGGTPDNQKRLEQNGFRNLGVNEPALKVPLFEIKKGLPSFDWACKLLYTIQAANR